MSRQPDQDGGSDGLARLERRKRKQEQKKEGKGLREGRPKNGSGKKKRREHRSFKRRAARLRKKHCIEKRAHKDAKRAVRRAVRQIVRDAADGCDSELIISTEVPLKLPVH